MKILLTGGTGFIGGALLRRLVEGGNAVTAVVRSEEAAATVEQAGARAVVGDLFDAAWLEAALREHEAAVHTASPGDQTSPEMDDAVVQAVIGAFGGTEKPFVHTGGIWTYGSNEGLTEDSTPAPPTITAWRREREDRLLDSEVRATVIEPGIVHAPGQGIAQALAGGPRTDAGALRLIGSGDQHWTTIHVDDLADLYITVLERGSDLGHLHGVSGESPTVREIGLAVADDVEPGTDAEAAEQLGEAFAEALLLDQQASGEKARSLGWTPTRPGLVEELRAGR